VLSYFNNAAAACVVDNVLALTATVERTECSCITINAGFFALRQELIIDRALTLCGAGRDVVTLSAAGGRRVMRVVAGGARVSLVGLRLTGGMVAGDDNHGGGGALLANNGTSVAMHACEVSNNHAAETGVGIEVFKANLFVSDSLIHSNTVGNWLTPASAKGGGVAWDAENRGHRRRHRLLCIEGTHIYNNTVSDKGPQAGAAWAHTGRRSATTTPPRTSTSLLPSWALLSRHRPSSSVVAFLRRPPPVVAPLAPRLARAAVADVDVGSRPHPPPPNPRRRGLWLRGATGPPKLALPTRRLSSRRAFFSVLLSFPFRLVRPLPFIGPSTTRCVSGMHSVSAWFGRCATIGKPVEPPSYSCATAKVANG
jgi:hypothetical protein